MKKTSNKKASSRKSIPSAIPEQLLTNTQLLQLLVDNVRDYAILLLAPEGRVLSWSAAAERLKGWKADEIIGQHISKFYPKEDVERGKMEMELQAAAREGRYE